MRALIINDKAKKSLADVKVYAEANVYDMDHLMSVAAMRTPPPGENPKHVAYIEDGYRVVFSMEQQKVGLIRHLSVSVRSDNISQLPSPEACNWIMHLLGFENEIKVKGPNNESLMVDIDSEAAVNIYEIVSNDNTTTSGA